MGGVSLGCYPSGQVQQWFLNPRRKKAQVQLQHQVSSCILILKNQYSGQGVEKLSGDGASEGASHTLPASGCPVDACSQ